MRQPAALGGEQAWTRLHFSRATVMAVVPRRVMYVGIASRDSILSAALVTPADAGIPLTLAGMGARVA